MLIQCLTHGIRYILVTPSFPLALALLWVIPGPSPSAYVSPLKRLCMVKKCLSSRELGKRSLHDKTLAPQFFSLIQWLVFALDFTLWSYSWDYS